MRYKSIFVVLFLSAILIFAQGFFYPKWNKSGSEASISWDVAGYYAYLPAFFIYHDLQHLDSTKNATIQYQCQAGDFYSAFPIANGNMVMKYSMGNALLMMPGFLVAHLWSLNSSYKADGFSFPYQFCIAWLCLIYAILSIFILRKILLKYFSDGSTAFSLLLIVIGTNYLEYAGISNGLTHNQLFLIYTLLLYAVVKFYESSKIIWASVIGVLIGLAVLTRPTEIILLIVPLFWNVTNIQTIQARLKFVFSNLLKYGSMLVCMLILISLQIIYWKTVANQWYVYSYGDQYFDWLQPHIYLGLLSARKGWYVFTPIMFFASVGFYFLWKNKNQFFITAILFMLLTIYFVFSWSEWWYATSYGQRAMIQSYAIMAFPLTALIEWLSKRNFLLKTLAACVFAICIYINLTFIWQAHYGKYFEGDNMTKRFLLRTMGRWNNVPNDLKLLDTDEEFKGERKNIQSLIKIDSTITLNSNYRKKEILLKLSTNNAKWIRATALFQTNQKEWNQWHMPQLQIRFSKNNAEIKSRGIKVSRIMDDKPIWQEIFLDEKIPTNSFDTIEIILTNSESNSSLNIKNLNVESYE